MRCSLRTVSLRCCITVFVSCLIVFFFFFKQKTAYEMRISDWSSDVCSSDLLVWFPQRSPRRIHDALRASDSLCSRIPGEVWAHYPADRPGGDRKSVV